MKIGHFWLLGDLLTRDAITLEIWDFWHQIGKPIALLFAMKIGHFGCLEISEEMQATLEIWPFLAKLVSL